MKLPLPPEALAHQEIKSTAMSQGLMCYPMAGTIDGVYGNHILLAPSFLITDDELKELVKKLVTSLEISAKSWRL